VNTNESISKKIFETKQLIALTQKQFDKSIQAIIDIEEYDKEINYKLAVQGVLEHLKIGVNGVILEKIEHLEKGSDEKIKKECEDRLSSFVKEYNTKNSLFTSKRDKFIDRYEVKLW
jgi:formate dehydrogenase maturation protein FdhE